MWLTSCRSGQSDDGSWANIERTPSSVQVPSLTCGQHHMLVPGGCGRLARKAKGLCTRGQVAPAAIIQLQGCWAKASPGSFVLQLWGWKLKFCVVFTCQGVLCFFSFFPPTILVHRLYKRRQWQDWACGLHCGEPWSACGSQSASGPWSGCARPAGPWVLLWDEERAIDTQGSMKIQ